jgi:hypothetical protein
VNHMSPNTRLAYKRVGNPMVMRAGQPPAAIIPTIWLPPESWLEGRTRLLSDNGSGYVSKALRDYCVWWVSVISWRRLNILILYGKMERYQKSPKREVSQLPYEFPANWNKLLLTSSTITTAVANVRLLVTWRRLMSYVAKEIIFSAAERRCKYKHLVIARNTTGTSMSPLISLDQSKRVGFIKCPASLLTTFGGISIMYTVYCIRYTVGVII